MRVLVYVPVAGADGRHREWIEQIESLRAALEPSGGKVTVLASALDCGGVPIPWPRRALRSARVFPPVRFESGALVEASDDAFHQLRDSIRDHDVVYIPQPLGALPWNRAAELPVPLAIGLHQRTFDEDDLGARTDRCLRELDSAFRYARGFLFPTRNLGEWAAARYPAIRGNIGIVPTIGSALRSHRNAGAESGLPERYLFAAGLARSVASESIAKELADTWATGRLPLPLVWVRERSDLPPYASFLQNARAEAIRDGFRRAGMIRDRDWFECEDPDDWAYRGLLAGATAVLGLADADGGLDWTAMSAHRSGVHLLHPRGEDDPDGSATSRSFDPKASGDLARALGEVLASTSTPAGSREVSSARVLESVLAKAIADFRILRRPAVRVPKPRDERVAWLISHTTLRDAEVPLLRELGYEVYTNKVLPSGEEYRSGSADSSWDDDSTLPADVLRQFNGMNFYQAEFTPEVADCLNEFFGTVISAAYPPLIRQLVLHFRGRILVRVFGREHPLSYGEYISVEAIGHRLGEIRHRFRFAACYEQIPEYEGAFLRDRAAVLPVALPDRALRTRGRWRGGDARILFVCPSIGSSPTYYGRIYTRFREVFGDIPHVIAGSQPIPIDDPNVTGFLTEERFMHLFETLGVMYYHSREPRHIHYHPIEAIVYGMPVVYLRGGLMDALDTGDKAGACDTEGEARAKVLRVLEGDVELIRAIQTSQITILDIFLPAYNLRAWRRIFHDQVMPADPAGLTDARPGSVAPAPSELDWQEGDAATPLHHFSHEELERVVRFEEPIVVVPPPAPIPSRNQQLRRWIPEPLQPSARAAYRALRSAKRLWRANPGVSPRELELTGRLGAQPESVPVEEAATEEFPAERFAALAEPVLDSTRLRKAFPSDRPSFFLDPVGRLDPNLRLEDLEEQNLVVAFTHLAWESEQSCGVASNSASRQAMLWCRMARHAVFATAADRTLAIHRYGLDPTRTSTLPVLVLTEFPYPIVTKPRPPGEVDGLPPKFMLAWCSDHTNANAGVLLEALAILRQRRIVTPPIVLAEHLPGAEWGRRSERIAHTLRTRLGVPGFAAGQQYFHLDGIADDEYQWLLRRGSVLSISIPRFGSRVVGDITRSALERIPSIATSIPAVTDAFGPAHDNILLVDPDDAVSLARAIELNLDNTEERKVRIDRAEGIARALVQSDDKDPHERLARAIAARLAASDAPD